MHTIKRLICNDEIYKSEFKKVNGYMWLEQMFNRNRSYEEEPAKQFLSDIYQLLILIIEDEKGGEQIVNYDAFNLLMHLMSNSGNFFIVDKAL